MGERILVVAAICGPRRVVWVNLSSTSDEQGLAQDVGDITLVGVLGHGAFMSFFLGRWPRDKVTLEGGAAGDVPFC